MASAIVYCPSGGGKTVNSVRVTAPNKGKNLLICTDNSFIVLKNFDCKNIEIQSIREISDMRVDDETLLEKAIESGKYDNIIMDNISDYFDMCITEMQLSGKFKDIRQAYQLVYQQLKMMARKSSLHGCNIIFTAWADNMEVILANGEKGYRISPKMPQKILDNMCGLVNIVAYINTVEKDGKKIWYYVLDGTPLLYAKDQLYCRKTCMPEDIFSGKVEK
ncbi:MAG: AAA family ATPase [Solibacillus sp.]